MGAVMAQAVEPHAASPAHDHGHDLCRNCGTRLIGAHCHACGQAGHVHRRVRARHPARRVPFRGEILEHAADARLPSGAADASLHRRRAGCALVSPMAQRLLFSVFLMFAVVANLPGWSFANTDLMKTDVSAELCRCARSWWTSIARLPPRHRRWRRGSPRPATRVCPTSWRSSGSSPRRGRTSAGSPRPRRCCPEPAPTAPPPRTRIGFEAKWRHARENPKLVLYKVKSSAYKYSWALIPISLPFIWSLFPFRRDVGMYDHAVFATYSLTFMSMTMICAGGARRVGRRHVPARHRRATDPADPLYKQLKGGYRLSRGGALWRTFVMVNFAAVTTVLFVMMLLYLGLAD
ncbi:hypothetical protein AB5I41_06620 [Sphingomonas sp. MMS24-JH45]